MVITTLVIGRSTTTHDVLYLWSPICNPSVWDTWGWVNSVARPYIPISSRIDRYGQSLTAFSPYVMTGVVVVRTK